jgi:Integrase core domain
LALHRTRKPVQNAFIESFNGRLRDELLNETRFAALARHDEETGLHVCTRLVRPSRGPRRSLRRNGNWRGGEKNSLEKASAILRVTEGSGVTQVASRMREVCAASAAKSVQRSSHDFCAPAQWTKVGEVCQIEIELLKVLVAAQQLVPGQHRIQPAETA